MTDQKRFSASAQSRVFHLYCSGETSLVLPDGLRSPVERCQVQRGLLPAVLDVWVRRPRLEQGADGGEVPVLGGAVKGRLLVGVLWREKRFDQYESLIKFLQTF